MKPETTHDPQLSDEQCTLISDLFPTPEPGPEGGRPAVESSPGFDGDRLGPPHGGALEGLAQVIPLVRHLLATLRPFERRRVARTSAGEARRRARPTRQNRLGRGLGRRYVRRGSSVPPKTRRGACVGLSPRGNGTKVIVLIDGQGLSLAVEIESPNGAEVNLAEPLVDAAFTRHVPLRLLYDKACDSDPLRKQLAERCVDLICPHRKGRVSKPTQNGRKLRRHRPR